VITVESRERTEREVRRQQEAALAEANRQTEIERRAEAERLRAAQAAEAKREAQRQTKIQAYGWPKDIEPAVIGRSVMPGMTAEQVTLAWGRPQRVNETIYAKYAKTRSEQWVYYSDRIVYFENGRVTAIQISRSGK
jgi:hypothetical protein